MIIFLKKFILFSICINKMKNIQKIIKKISSYKNIEFFFLITFKTEDIEEDDLKDEFQNGLNKKNELDKINNKNETFTEEEIKKLIDNTFCLDLLNFKYSEVISKILLKLNQKIKKYEESNNYIKECIQNYYYLNYSDYIYCCKKKAEKKISGNEITNIVDGEENSEEKKNRRNQFFVK